MQVSRSAIRLGVLYDFPHGDGGVAFEQALRLGLAAAAPTDRDIEFVTRHARGLPIGSEHEFTSTFGELVGEGVIAIVGPSISDNALMAAPLCDAARIAAINYSGGERTRSAWMFHYQVGSLEEEPPLLANRMVERGLQRAAVVFDQSPVGRRYFECFEAARARLGLELTASVAISPLADSVDRDVARLAASGADVLVYFGLGMASHAVALARQAANWDVPVLANSSLMFGYIRPDWRDGFAGWEYVDTIADDNASRAELRALDPATAAGPVGCAAYDIGRLVGEAFARIEHLTRAGFADALRRVKWLPATSGEAGTLMGFGNYDHGALKGHFLVLREWKDGRSTQVSRP